jgi:hypothetical protein
MPHEAAVPPGRRPGEGCAALVQPEARTSGRAKRLSGASAPDLLGVVLGHKMAVEWVGILSPDGVLALLTGQTWGASSCRFTLPATFDLWLEKRRLRRLWDDWCLSGQSLSDGAGMSGET